MKTAVFVFLTAMLVGGCSPKQLYLVGPKIEGQQPDILKVCLDQTINEINSGSPPLSLKDKGPLKGIQTDYFLWLGSLSGPKPVITKEHLPGETRTVIPHRTSKELSDRYVLCLSTNEYEFPN